LGSIELKLIRQWSSNRGPWTPVSYHEESLLERQILRSPPDLLNQDLQGRGPEISVHTLTGDPDVSEFASRSARVDGQRLPANVQCAVSIGRSGLQKAWCALPVSRSLHFRQTLTSGQLGRGRRHPFFRGALTGAAWSSKTAHFHIVTNIYNPQFF